MKTPTTRTRLSNLIQTDMDAGRKVQCLEVDDGDRASLISEIRLEKTPLAKEMKARGIDVALAELNGVPLKWRATVTRTVVRATTAAAAVAV
jgi:hypothetical protein